MKRVQQVLEERGGEIAQHLVLRQEMDDAQAERFVDVAGRELMASWEWQASSLQVDDLASWANAQRLLAGMHAKSLASQLDLPPERVWRALRAFVPRVLILATRGGASASPRGAGRTLRPGPSYGATEARATVTW